MHATLTRPCRWRSQPAPSLDILQRAWLQRPGALTAGLRQLGRLELFVALEKVAAVPAGWAEEIHLPAGTPVWWREICMTLNGRPVVQACSFTPRPASLGAWGAIRSLNRHPLADILYQDPCIRRSRFRFARRRQPRIEARHSVFMRHQAPLLVAEFFLPAFWPLARQAAPTGLPGRFHPCGCG